MLKKFGWKSWYSFWYTKFFVGSEGGEYDFKAPLYIKFPGLLRKPFKIEIEHTTVCNKKCIFCSHTHFDENQEMMSFDKYKYLIDSIPSLKWVNIAGIGSFFLNKDSIKMLEYARKKHLNINFVDEFDFFDENKAIQIVKLGVNSIYVSFDAATKETYEKIKLGCYYDKALSNIKTLLRVKEKLESPFPVLHFRFMVTKLNYHEMPDFVNLIASLPNRGVRSRVEFIGLISYPEIEKYYVSLEKVPNDIIVKTFQNVLRNKINLYFSHASSALPPMNCCARWAEPFILVNGNVISDCAILMQHKKEFLNKYSFGNAFQKSFMDIWKSPIYKKFRRLVVKKNGKVPKSCRQCCAYNNRDRVLKYGIWDFSKAESQNR
jgi:MoaA/NifB/PqqE/SkfB family radical SAM enzyme